MQGDLEQGLRDFAEQARALAERIRQEDGTPSVIEAGRQTRVEVLPASPEPTVVGELRGIANSVDLYRQERQIHRGQFPPQR